LLANFFHGRLFKSYTIKGLRRIEKLEIPEIAIREVLINALVHRNYTINAPIKIAIYDDRLEFFSPGLFPGPLNIENLEQGLTYIRNIVITEIFREAGVIEKLGSGFKSLFSSYRDSGLDSPTIVEGLNFVRCILPRHVVGSHEDINRLHAERARDSATLFKPIMGTSTINPTEYDVVLNLFQDQDEISMAMVLEKTGWARATAGRRLKKLMVDGKIRKFGGGRFSRYRLPVLN
jgi:ATP-dependent DNA helicase RecG